MAVHRRYDILAIMAGVVGLLAYASFESEFRLRPEMPVEFFDASRMPQPKRAAEEQIARAYWKCAVNEVQWRYGYARRLPDDPPPEFAVAAAELAPAADPVTRARYWRRLREVWGISSIWNEHYEFNTLAIRNSLQSAGDSLERLMRRITGYS